MAPLPPISRCSSRPSSDYGSTDATTISDDRYPLSLDLGYSEIPLSGQEEQIAVVGMGCRLPGDVNSPSELWNLIMDKGTGRMAKAPKSRFNIDAFLHPNHERPGSINIPGGYFLNCNLKAFDPQLFGISPVEAMWMDPQQRLMLEVVYETLESAGVTLDAISGTTTGCFIGSYNADYQHMTIGESDFRHSYAATGVEGALISNRVSHIFNITGPSMTLNTSCSSSMYALHTACNALKNDECCAAIVGGANLILTIEQHMNIARIGVLSPTSTCHTFNAHVDGYGRADGVCAIYLKKLRDAIRDRNPIRGVIRSTAVNSNGKTPGVGITHPSAEAQEAVIRQAYRLGGDLDPRLTTYVEMHGTGTAVGDPLEARGVSKAMNDKRSPRDGPLLVGSIKTNVGHNEASSGLTGVIKAVLAVENGIIPPTRGFTSPNPAIDWKNWNIQVVSEPTPFPTNIPIRRVGVSSFGYGGTNGHAVIEAAGSFLSAPQACVKDDWRKSLHPKKPHLLVFSAHNKVVLNQNIQAHSMVADKYGLIDLAHTLGNRRSLLSSRAYVVTNEATKASDFRKLSKLCTFGEKKENPTVGFIFTGQGGHWIGMAKELISFYPSFLSTLKDLDRILQGLPDKPEWSIETQLLAESDNSRLFEAEISQPLCTAIQIGLVDLLASWNVKPVATAGHSSGEIASAYAAGKISRMEAIILAFYRGRILLEDETGGAMLAVGLGPEEVKPYIIRSKDITIACHNSPSSVSLSGKKTELEIVQSKLEEKNVFARMIDTGNKAYHSRHMKRASIKYTELLRNARNNLHFDQASNSDIKMISSVTGLPILPDRINDTHWESSIVAPVLFNDAIRQMLSLSIQTLIEIGPHSALAGPLRQIKAEQNHEDLVYLPTLNRHQDCSFDLLKLAGELFLLGYPINMDRVTLVELSLPSGSIGLQRGNLLVDLPPYQWSHGSKAPLAEARHSLERRNARHDRHDLLGRRLPGGSEIQPVWRNVLRVDDLPWLKDHRLSDDVVVPVSAFFSMAIEAITRIAESTGTGEFDRYILRDLVIRQALVIPEDSDGIETIFAMRHSIYGKEESCQWWDFSVSSASSEGVQEELLVGAICGQTYPRERKPKEIPDLPRKMSGEACYRVLKTLGVDYGPTFRDMEEVYFDDQINVASSRTVIKQECGAVQRESRYVLHPTTVDSCLQLAILSMYAGMPKEMTHLRVPIEFEEIVIWYPTKTELAEPNAVAHAWIEKRGTRLFELGCQLVGNDGSLLVQMNGARFVSYEAAAPQKPSERLSQQPYMELTWKCDIDHLRMAQENPSGLAGALWFLELLLHKDPDAKIWDIDGHNSDLLNEDAAHINYRSGSLFDKHDGKYDMILANSVEPSPSMLASVVKHLNRGGHAVLKRSHKISLRSFELAPVASDNGLVLASYAVTKMIGQVLREQISFAFVYRHTPAPLVSKIISDFSKRNWKTRLCPMKGARINENERVVVVAELEGPLLSSLEEAELKGIQNIVSITPSVLWITNGGLLQGKRPEYAMVSGLARSVVNESASLDFISMDFDLDTTSLSTAICAISNVVWRQIENIAREFEYCIAQDRVYISRLSPLEELNAVYSMDRPKFKEVPYDSDRATVARVESKQIIFEQDSRSEDVLQPHQIEISVALSGLTKDGVDAIQGRDLRLNFSHEVFGTITKVGSAITHYLPGERVVGFNLDRYASFQRVSQDLVAKLRLNDDPTHILGCLMPYASALYGLRELARVQPNENILVLANAGLAGTAAISVGKMLGANVYVQTGSETNSAQLASALQLPETHILTGLTDIAPQLIGSGKFDVVFCAGLSPAEARNLWRQIAPLGRVVACGYRNTGQTKNPSPVPLNRGATYYSFDILDLYHYRQGVLGRVLRMILMLYRQGSISAIGSPVVKHLAELNDAVENFSEHLLQDRILISYENKDTTIKLAPARMTPRFNPQATYLLVGCLGGIGRSIASWMLDKGSRRFLFLSRSGSDSESAKLFITGLERRGAYVQVVRGNVCDKKDVETAVKSVSSEHPIAGVVQAASTFQDAPFRSMTHEQWTSSIGPKVIGTLNLHEALFNVSLDFFITTGSIGSLIGTLGQANYAAANKFLFSFARHCQLYNRKACNLVLTTVSDVGHVAKNRQVEEVLNRQGIYMVDEEDVLQLFEAALSTGHSRHLTEHIILGADPSALQNVSFADAYWIGDPRFRALVRAIGSAARDTQPSRGSILDAIKSATSQSNAIEIATTFISEKLVRLLRISREEIEPKSKSIFAYGLDSLVGVELRNWIYKELDVQISFQKLLAPSLTIERLASIVCTS